MRGTSEPRRVLTWTPSRARRFLVTLGLSLSIIIRIARLFLVSWSWHFGNGVFIQVLFGVVLVPTLILLCQDLRLAFPSGHCRHCGYCLTGNTSGVCPECGTPVRFWN
jgi:hypothetical protein